MAETLQLRLQECDFGLHRPDRTPIPGVLHIVSGIELPDGTHFQSPVYNHSAPQTEIALDWPAIQAENAAAFYERYLTQDRGKEGWNCHSFVAKTMGWPMRWHKNDAHPANMPYDIRQLIEPDELQDGVPYAIDGDLLDGRFEHSMMGINNPELSLSILGFCRALYVARNDSLQAFYGEDFYPHTEPAQSYPISSYSTTPTLSASIEGWDDLAIA